MAQPCLEAGIVWSNGPCGQKHGSQPCLKAGIVYMVHHVEGDMRYRCDNGCASSLPSKHRRVTIVIEIGPALCFNAPHFNGWFSLSPDPVPIAQGAPVFSTRGVR